MNPSSGTVALSLPLPLTPARNGFVPPVKLRYNSGSGNSVVGLGWSLDMPAIRRRTDHRLPRYRDRDSFVLHDAEDLVPAARWIGDAWQPEVAEIGAYTVRRYRPRVEGGFARIEQIAHATLGTWWRVTTRDNLTTFYGVDSATRIADPSAPDHVFEWLPALAFDDQGDCVVYDYRAEDLVSVPHTLAEANRRSGLAPFVNKHLARMRWGNRVPCHAADDPYRPPTIAGAFMFEAVCDHGDHDAAQPTPEPAAGRAWPTRSDPFSSHRSGFDIRTYRLLHRVLMFHRFDELAGGAPTLVRSLDFTYESSSTGAPVSEVTYLRSLRQCGYARRPDGSYAKQALPALELAYQPLQWNTHVETLDRESMADLPAGATDKHEWMDLFGEGIAGLFTEEADAWFYKQNLGDPDEDGRVKLDRYREVLAKPSFTGVSRGVLQLRDRGSDGRTQLVVLAPELQGYFDRGDGSEWLPFRSFEAKLTIDLADRHLRMLDLDGDGRADVLISEDNALVWYRACERGYEPAERAVKPHDEERGPSVVFAEDQQTIFLADMTGDGLVDIVRIRNGDVCYWPNLGYGRFGAKVAMDRAPVLAPPDLFDARYVRLADVSGTGASDLLYLGPQGATAYLNFSGNAWSAAQPIAPSLPSESPNAVTVTDLLGNGTACVVWSSALPGYAAAPLRYLDLMGGAKPHLLVGYTTNLGKEVAFRYKSSTYFYLRDKLDGRPWVTRLPFPVHCLRELEVRDRIAGTRLTSSFRYHHGYYDRSEREFRGFGMVEQRDSETFERWSAEAGRVVDRARHQPPILTRTWFHTGAITDRAAILSRFRDEYWDREMARQGFAVVANEPALPDARLVAAPGIDPAALSSLSSLSSPTSVDWREALRACKGMVLRKEVFALDAPDTAATPAQLHKQLSPYTAATHNCVIELLQPARGDDHAVFVVKESEAITWTYERELGDPRVEHILNVALDEYGNVLESATVVYGRVAPDLALPQPARDAQTRTHVTYTTTEMTNDAITAVHHRLRRASRATTYELVGVAKPGALYAIADLVSPGHHVLADAVDIPAHQTGVTPPAGTVFRRRLRASQTVFYDDTLAAPLALHTLNPRALTFETYELAYTAAHVAHVFGARATDAVMIEAGYVHRGDADWWLPSGRWEYLGAGEAAADARARFFAHVAHRDAFGGRTTIGYFGSYFLMPARLEDAVHNVTRADAYDLRALAPSRIVDANDNVSELVLDELGWVKATAVRGKGDEGDDLAGITAWSTAADDAARAALLAAADSTALAAAAATLIGSATARYVYDATQSPPVSATIAREQHAAVAVASPLQISFEYANGAGKVELRKVQAEPGVARRVVLGAGDSYTIEDVDTSPGLRWLGTGRRVVNNKGNPVEEYEPFFSVTHTFEAAKELVESGVTRVTTYDPVDRVIRVDHPDATFTRTDFGAWTTIAHDRNDTVLASAWYTRRIERLIDAELVAAGKDPVREAEAASQTAAHAATPRVQHLDSLGRAVLEIDDDGLDDAGQPLRYATHQVRDVDGKVVAVIDPRGITTIAYDHDLRGQIAAHASADGGKRWMLDDATGQPARAWDERGHEIVFTYDPLRRPATKRVRGGDGPTPLDHVFEQRTYGEGRRDDKAHNLRGRIALLYDTAGRIENVDFDFKGNLVRSTRRFATDAKAVPDWSGVDPDAALRTEVFTSSATYDALDRVASRTAADATIYRPSYNAANLLEQVRITQGGATAVYVSNIDYDAKGQRERIAYGNGVTTTYAYDRETFRIVGITSTARSGATLQDLHYTYDPVGNVTHLDDRAVPTVWFDNHMITGLCAYRYTPTYRLAQATGREHAAQVDFGATDNWSDGAHVARHATSDPLVWRNYTEQYRYDAAGNIAQLAHASTHSWTRDYAYATASNRLVSTTVGATTFRYAHHATHGFMTAMPHLTVMRWSFRDELSATSTQAVAEGTPETTWYVYDGNGKRVRKITERAAGPGATPSPRAERLYLDGVELYREYDGGGAVTAERSTFEVMDDKQRIALVEREGATRLVRYQGGDHLQSAHLETDEAGRVISYEVFHPFGTTAYQAADKATLAAAKRYRYTGLERDNESGLEYHGARYYAPWLGRWIAADRHPEQLDGNRYAYVKNNPVNHRDSNGFFEEPTHGVLTYRLALAAGIPPADAARIAIAAAAMDHDPETRPAGVGDIAAFRRIPQTERYHYPVQDPYGTALAGVRGDIADQRAGIRRDNDLERFGQHLHTLEDIGFVEAPGPHMRHDPGRGQERILSPTLGLLGMALASGTLAGGVALLQGGASLDAKVAGGIALGVVFGFGIYLLVLAFRTENIGHPQYRTERGEISNSFRHTADQAPQDPSRNTAELLLVYEELKAYARARYGDVQPDDDAARAAISQDVTAVTSCQVSNFANERPVVHGVRLPSYTQILSSRTADRGRSWTPRAMDVTTPSGIPDWSFQGRPGRTQVCPAVH